MKKTPYLFDEFFSSGLEESVSPFLTDSSRKYSKNLSLKAALVSAFFLLLAFIFSFISIPASYICLVFVFFLSGTHALIESIEDLRHFEINIDVLMTLAAFLSVLIDSALEGGLLLVLFALSGAMEEMVERKSKSALYKLREITPTFAHVLNPDGSTFERSVKEIETNTLLIIKPGDIVPLDGTVVEGRSYVNLVHLTGESQPISKAKDENVQAGAKNLDGTLTIKVTKTSNESTLSRIIKLIHHAQETKPKVQKFLDRFGKIYAITIIALSVVFATLLPFILKIPYSGYEGSIYRALAFLIAASPCALIIATPTAYLSAISSCAKNGVLLKGGVSLDGLSKCDTIAFDKTGTLTTGNLRCSSIKTIFGGNCSEDKALSIAATLEKYAHHPIAYAITEEAKEKKLLLHSVEDFKSIAGYGLEGVVNHERDAEKVFIGNPEYIYSKIENLSGAKESLDKAIESSENAICVLLAYGTIILFEFKDEIRENALTSLNSLKEKFNLKLVMLTGDHKRSAEHVAKSTSIDDVHFDLRPEDKLKIVSSYAEKSDLAMVGDGINDAPALARSTIGISMGGVGSDTAIDASDVVLLQDDLSHLCWLYAKAKKTHRIVRQNLALALAVIFLTTTPALLGYIPLWLAVILHEGGTVIVGLNSLRLLKK